jgi:hypothetical protein
MPEIQRPEADGGSSVNYADLLRDAQQRGEATPDRIIDPDRAQDLAKEVDKFMPMTPLDPSLTDADFQQMVQDGKQARADEHADRAHLDRRGLTSIEDGGDIYS